MTPRNTRRGMDTQEKFYRFYYLNLLTGEKGCSVSKIPESDRDIWFEHLSRTEPTFAYWSKEIKAEETETGEELSLDNDQQL